MFFERRSKNVAKVKTVNVLSHLICEESHFVVDISIVLVVWEEFGNPGAFIQVLTDVRLNSLV